MFGRWTLVLRVAASYDRGPDTRTGAIRFHSEEGRILDRLDHGAEMNVRRTIAIAALVALALSACAVVDSRTPEATLRVMSYNIRLDLASDGANAWPHRREAVANLIRLREPHVIGLQEALPSQLEDLDVLLPGYQRFGSGRNADLLGEHTAIYYRADRLELQEHATFWLSETPDVPGSRGWDAAYERIATWGRFRDRATGTEFVHFNTHFDHVGMVARRESARLIVRTLDEIRAGLPVVITGDFNDIPTSESNRIIEEAGYADAHGRSVCPPQGPDSTWNGFTAIEPGRRIDFIFVRGEVSVLRHAILPDRPGGRFPSDHLPVVAEVVIGADARTAPQCR